MPAVAWSSIASEDRNSLRLASQGSRRFDVLSSLQAGEQRIVLVPGAFSTVQTVQRGQASFAGLFLGGMQPAGHVQSLPPLAACSTALCARLRCFRHIHRSPESSQLAQRIRHAMVSRGQHSARDALAIRFAQGKLAGVGAKIPLGFCPSDAARVRARCRGRATPLRIFRNPYRPPPSVACTCRYQGKGYGAGA